jgi:hypothetical protein
MFELLWSSSSPFRSTLANPVVDAAAGGVVYTCLINKQFPSSCRPVNM